jgi:MEDS: MEthanogen/methylotroph, DcmR Sensory domain
MTGLLRNTGIARVGEKPWATHFCHFYETPDDLLETLIPFLKAGLESKEFCAWVVSEPLTEDGAWQALDRAVPDLKRYVSDHSIEVLNARDVYLAGGEIDRCRIMDNWNDKLNAALSKGYQGIRASGDMAWLGDQQWADFMEYEAEVNRSVSGQSMLLLCTYPLQTSAAHVHDVTRTHQFAVAKRRGSWEVVEAPACSPSVNTTAEYLLRPSRQPSRMRTLRALLTRTFSGLADLQHALYAGRCSQCGRFGAGTRFRWCVGGHKLHPTCVKYEMGREACPICGIAVSEFPT